MPFTNGIYRPDFQAPQVDLPQWQQMGGEDQNQQLGQTGGSFVDALKKRMAGGATKGNAPAPSIATGKAMSGGGGASSL